MQTKKHCGKVFLIFIGIVLIGFGSGILIFFESIYDGILHYGLEFSPTSRLYREWERSPPVETNIYVFNWTNPGQIRNISVKPEFEEIGPYRFYEIRGKGDISWFDHYVDYKGYASTFFDETKDGRNLSDVLTTVNTVALSLGYQLRFQSYWTKKIVSLGLSSKSAKLYVTKSARELFFEGYSDPLLGILSKLPFLQAPEKGGFFYGRNGTLGVDGTYRMHYTNDEHFGEVLLSNGETQTNFFSGECNDVKGSAGEFFPLDRKRDQIVLFSSDLCKSLVLDYVEDVTIKGVRGYKYSADNGFDNGTVKPENACFCNGECIPSGVFNISSCRMGSPSFLSFPHFYNADPVYRNAVKGMKPNKTHHEFYMILEPKSGVLMEAQAGFQLNMLFQPVSSISLFEKLPRTFLPIFYLVHKMDLTDDIALILRLIQNLPEYSYYLVFTLIIVGCCCISGALISFFCCKKKSETVSLTGISRINPPQKNHVYEQVPLKEKQSDIEWSHK